MVNLTIVSTLGYEQAILIQKNKDEYINVINVNIIVSMGFSFLILLVFFIFKDWILSAFNITAIGQWIYLLPVVVLLNIFTQIVTTISVKNKQFKLSSYARMGSMVGSKFYAIYHGWFINNAISGFIISEIIGKVIFLITSSFNKHVIHNYYLALRNIFSIKVFQAAGKNSNYPFFTLPSILLNTLVMQLPIYFIVNKHGPEIGGYYSLANTLLTIPLTLISRSIGIVFSQRASELYNTNQHKQLRSLIIKIIKFVAIVTIPALLCIVLFGEQLFVFLLGGNWLMSGRFAQFMVIYFSFEMVVFPLTYLYMVFRIEKRLLQVSLAGFAFVFSSLWIGIRFDDPVSLILCLSIGKIFDSLLKMIGLFTSSKIFKVGNL